MPICARTGCGNTFEPGKRGSPKKYCSKKCGGLVGAQRFVERHPERRRAINKAWSDRNKGYRRDYHLKSVRGLTREQFDNMLIEQGGLCAMCDKPMDGPKDAVVDHDHITGKVRALLHHRCNVGLPYVEDADFKALAERYLEKHHG